MNSLSKTRNQVIDAHTHIASPDFLPDAFADGVVANIDLALTTYGLRSNRDKVKELFLSKFQDPLCDELVSEMNESGIDQSILLAADFTYALKDCRLTIEEILLHHKKVVERHKLRFQVFSGVDPRWGKDGIDLFERSIRDFGFSGYKIYPPCGYNPSDPILYPFYEICAQWQIPVLTHVGGTSPALAFDTAAPVLLDKAAREFPHVDFILAHGTVSYVEECAMMCSFRPNVYLDISGFQTAELALLEQIFRRGYKHKIIFGTDWPLFRLQGTQNECVSRLNAETGPLQNLTDGEMDAFYGGIISRLLGKKKMK